VAEQNPSALIEPAASADGWVTVADRHLGTGQLVRAIDTVRKALTVYPDHLGLRLLGAQAWLRAGAVREVQADLATLGDRLDTRAARLTRLFQAMQAIRLDLKGAGPDAVALARVAALVHAFAPATGAESAVDTGPDAAATLDRLIDLFAGLWRQSGNVDHLRRARDYALVRPADGTAAVPAMAAVLSWHLGEREQARGLARQALSLASGVAIVPGERRLGPSLATALQREAAARVQAAVLLEAEVEADAALAEALRAMQGAPVVRTALRRELSALASAGVRVPDRVLTALPPAVVAICAGQAIDLPGQTPPIFPSHLERAVAAAIDQAVESLGVEIAYVGAGAGADILFIEALLRRGAEVNIMIPCDPNDFVGTRVLPAGPVWERRHRHALRLADTVTVVTEDQEAGEETLIRFANQVIDGSARLRAEVLGTDPYLVAAGDHSGPAIPGGPADFIDNWGDPARLRMIHLDQIRDAQPPVPDPSSPPAAVSMPSACASVSSSPSSPVMAMAGGSEGTDAGPRVVRTMLFADVVGFTRLAEAELPAFWQVMEVVARGMTTDRWPPPVLIESWGDALYVVMETAEALAGYAFSLLRAVRSASEDLVGLSEPLRFRVGLHAGPVRRGGTHPLTGRPMVTGRHVSRGSRIEAIAGPGQVYASQQFVALLTAEASAARAEARMRGEGYRAPYDAVYLGVLDLPKAFGPQAIYRLRETESGE